MKICVAQVRPVKGDIQKNIEGHKKLIDLAVSNYVDTIIFPELSLTGYEPALANELSLEVNDKRLQDFQKISDSKKIIIGVGVPLKSASGTCIAMILFRPAAERQTYIKRYLHADEEAFFVSGQGSVDSIGKDPKIAFAICYELSIADHSQKAFDKGAKIYIASVAKSAAGVEKASKTLSEIAAKYSMIVLMSNCVGYCDNFEAGGNSAAWNNNGILTGQMNNSDEGIIVLDTDTGQVFEKII